MTLFRAAILGSATLLAGSLLGLNGVSSALATGSTTATKPATESSTISGVDTPTTTISDATKGAGALKKSQIEALKFAFRAVVEQKKNGMNVALASAKANEDQAIAAAGKNRPARLAAISDFNLATQAILSVYQTAIATAKTDLVAAILAIKSRK